MGTAIAERRLANLRLILASEFEGNEAALSRAIDRPAAMVYQWLTNNARYKRNIGEKAARHIETALGFQEGFLDHAPRQTTHNQGTPHPPTLGDTLRSALADLNRARQILQAREDYAALEHLSAADQHIARLLATHNDT